MTDISGHLLPLDAVQAAVLAARCRYLSAAGWAGYDAINGYGTRCEESVVWRMLALSMLRSVTWNYAY